MRRKEVVRFTSSHGHLCPHTERLPGPRVPALYGSFATEVCTACGFYRTTTHTPGPWTPGPVPVDEPVDPWE
jgi:hypothetical protein